MKKNRKKDLVAKAELEELERLYLLCQENEMASISKLASMQSQLDAALLINADLERQAHLDYWTIRWLEPEQE